MPQVLNMSGFSICRSYNDMIIIVTNVIILESLSAQFIHRGAPQLNILSFLPRVRK